MQRDLIICNMVAKVIILDVQMFGSRSHTAAAAVAATAVPQESKFWCMLVK